MEAEAAENENWKRICRDSQPRAKVRQRRERAERVKGAWGMMSEGQAMRAAVENVEFVRCCRKCQNRGQKCQNHDRKCQNLVIATGGGRRKEAERSRKKMQCFENFSHLAAAAAAAAVIKAPRSSRTHSVWLRVTAGL